MPIPGVSPDFLRAVRVQGWRWDWEVHRGIHLGVSGGGSPITRAVSTYNHIAGRSSSREFVSAP